MLKNHKDLYKDLLKLTQEEESPFVKMDYQIEDKFLRVFDYVLASYSAFQKESAIESRGIMFQVTQSGDFLKLLCLPMPKFFNYNENPSTMNIGDYIIEKALLKEDGSLTSTFMLSGEVYLKSKGSVCSPQAILATELLRSKPVLRDGALVCERNNYTVNMEYAAPENRIVLAYEQPQLIVLNARSKSTGKFMPHSELKEIFGEYTVSLDTKYTGMRLDAAANAIYPLTDIEGYVVFASNGKDQKIMKFKTHWYKQKHTLKDSCRADTKEGVKALFNLTILGEVDDLRSDFTDDKPSLEAIELVEKRTIDLFNKSLEFTYHFVNDNKELDRKSFFLKLNESKNELPNSYLASFVGNMYQGLGSNFSKLTAEQQKDFKKSVNPPILDKSEIASELKKFLLNNVIKITEKWRFNPTLEKMGMNLDERDLSIFERTKFKRI